MMLDRGFPRTVTIYGTGLIGCSFALALKQTIPGVRLFGIDSADILSRARAIGAIDSETGQSESMAPMARARLNISALSIPKRRTPGMVCFSASAKEQPMSPVP